MISCSTRRGVACLVFGIGSAANGTDCNAPSPTISKRLLPSLVATGASNICQRVEAAVDNSPLPGLDICFLNCSAAA